MPTALLQDQTVIPAINEQPKTLQSRSIRVVRHSSSPDGSRQSTTLTMSVTISKVSL